MSGAGWFKEIGLSNFTRQMRADRFPDPHNLHLGSRAEHIIRFADHIGFGSKTLETYTGPPHVAIWRMNLVALSQNHNLYFLVSRDNLHCYAPRDLKQTLPSRPDLIIQLPRTKDGVTVGGFVDDQHPHSVNHLMLGNLGDMEILLMACDDGDVLAFYTHQIQAEMTRAGVDSRVRDVQPFFHQNVGATAWGLAIHQKSRLIAVSSNLKEVTIFVHGYSEHAVDEEMMESAGHGYFPLLDNLDPPPTSFRDRGRNYRIVIEIENGHNLPSVDFVSDRTGEAEQVIAVDINGKAWLFSPFKPEDQAVIPNNTLVTKRDRLEEHRGWGILCLPMDDFKPTNDIHDSLGLRKMDKVLIRLPLQEKGYSETFLDVTPPPPRTLSMSSRWYQAKPVLALEAAAEGNSSRPSEFDDIASRSTGPVSPRTLRLRNPVTSVPHSYLASLERKGDKERKDRDKLLQLAKDRHRDTDLIWLLVNIPRSMRTYIHSWKDLIERGKVFDYFDRHGIVPVVAPSQPRIVNNPSDPQVVFLRTYCRDVELLSLPVLENIDVRMTQPLHIPNSQRFDAFHRFNFLARIPDLNLVIVGSQAGRVLVITLTKLIHPGREGQAKQKPFVGFRLDQILPTMKQVYPACPLLGMAVGPLQSAAEGEEQVDKKVFHGRWRLFLHYYDHSVLTYELWRDEDGLLNF